jgi:hypothetical protein
MCSNLGVLSKKKADVIAHKKDYGASQTNGIETWLAGKLLSLESLAFLGLFLGLFIFPFFL